MSAVRSSQARSQARRNRAAPYGRSIFSTIGRFLGLLADDEGEEDSSDDAQLDVDSDGSSGSAQTQAHASSANTFRLANGNGGQSRSMDAFPHSRPLQSRPALTGTRSLNSPSSPPRSSSAQQTQDITGVASMLSQTTGRSVTTTEAQSIISMLQNTRQLEPQQRFRFSITPTRETPPTNQASTSSAAPRKMLTKNPNGTYRWEGGGSAKRPLRRNRFASPAFAPSPLRPTARLSSSINPSGDGKRRKLAEDASKAESKRRSASPEESLPIASVPFPITSTPQRPPKLSPAVVITPARHRTPAKPTTPVVPSPLRHAWNDSPASSPERGASPTNGSKQSKTASFMAELIQDSTPVKKFSLSNPYQDRNPGAKVAATRRGARRPRAAARTEQANDTKTAPVKEKTPPPKELAKEPSAHAIIEATLPPGSKRSRPPSNLSAAEPSAGQEKPMDADEDQMREDQTRSSKRSKSAFGSTSLTTAAKTQVEDDGEDAAMVQDKAKEKALTLPAPVSSVPTSTISPAARNAFTGKATSIPKEPSKLRFSIKPESTPSSPVPAPATLTSPTPADPAPPLFNMVPSSSSSGFTFSNPTPPAPSPFSVPEAKPVASSTPTTGESVKRKASEMEANTLPTFEFSAPSTSTAPMTGVRREARFVLSDSLPTFTFTYPPSGDTSAVACKPQVKGFDFAAAGVKPPTTTTDKWTCPTCSINNADQASQCAACEEPKPGSSKPASSSSSLPAPPPVPASGFNWGAAGIKPQAKVGWSCPTCMVNNNDSAVQCTACEEPKPGSSKPTPAPAVAMPSIPSGGFNWGAAGVKPQGKAGWQCSTCMVSNSDSATQCVACEEPKPGLAKTKTNGTVPAPPSMPTAPSGGFNWSAAGLKPIAKSGWTCSICSVSNADSAAKCVACEEPKPGSTAPAAPPVFSMPSIPAGGFSWGSK